MRARGDGAGHMVTERERDKEKEREREERSVNDVLLALGQTTSPPPLF